MLELLAAFEEASGAALAHRIMRRRPGDVAELVAAPERARRELGWQAKRDIGDMCRDAWRFQSKNPHGYPTVDLLHDQSPSSQSSLLGGSTP